MSRVVGIAATSHGTYVATEEGRVYLTMTGASWQEVTPVPHTPAASQQREKDDPWATNDREIL